MCFTTLLACGSMSLPKREESPHVRGKAFLVHHDVKSHTCSYIAANMRVGATNYITLLITIGKNLIVIFYDSPNHQVKVLTKSSRYPDILQKCHY